MITAITASETRHGCAVAVGDIGLLILGDSGSGKSTLIADMLGAWGRSDIRLVADDRVQISRMGDKLVARPHPAIAGKLEIRGYGIVAMPCLEAVVLRGCVRLNGNPLPRLPDPDEHFDCLEVSLPCIGLANNADAAGRMKAIWPHFRERVLSAYPNMFFTP